MLILAIFGAKRAFGHTEQSLAGTVGPEFREARNVVGLSQNSANIGFSGAGGISEFPHNPTTVIADIPILFLTVSILSDRHCILFFKSFF